jgi:hypothetical protein
MSIIIDIYTSWSVIKWIAMNMFYIIKNKVLSMDFNYIYFYIK